MRPLTDEQMRYASAASRLPLFLMPLIAACAASVPLEQAGLLSSYQQLAPSSGVLTQAQVSVDSDRILAAKTVRIIPTSLSTAVAEAKLSEAQLAASFGADFSNVLVSGASPFKTRTASPAWRRV